MKIQFNWQLNDKIGTHLQMLMLSCCIALSFSLGAQNWTEPVQINSLPGLNTKPDFCIGNDGTIHVVWSYRIEQFYRVIYYSKSTDDGLSWSVPENVSQNESHWMENPHVAVDSKNQIHLTYDVNVQSPGNTHVVYRHFDGQCWSPQDTLSAGWPGSRHSKMVVDSYDKLFCFWVNNYQYGSSFWREMENCVWGDIGIVYNNNDSYYLAKAVIDTTDVIHCAGYHVFYGQSSQEQKTVYSTYKNQQWSELTQVSHDYQVWVGIDLALDQQMHPHIVWRQAVSNTIPPNDGTIYSFLDETGFTAPVTIVEDPSDQAIAIDRHNNVHIVDNEKYENGYRLMHYQMINDEWVGGDH